MQLIRWISLCAIVGGVGVVLSQLILGGEYFAALTGGNPDIPVMGGVVALVGFFTFFVSNLEKQKGAGSKESSGWTNNK
jgi:hypothetical protein